MSDQKLPIYERFIQRHFPAWGARRLEARARASAMSEAWSASGTRKGANRHRLGYGWGASTSYIGGTAQDRAEIADMRDRARDVARNNAVAKNLLKTELDNVVADGLTFQSKTGLKSPAGDGADAEVQQNDFDREQEEKWAAWLEIADLRGIRSAAELQRQLYRSPRRDGDGGVVLYDAGGNLRLQYVPGDLIRSPYGKNVTLPVSAGNTLVDGVEINAASAPVAFHICQVDTFGRESFARVPAANFVFLFHEDEFEDMAVRGESCFATVLDRLEQLDGYVDAVVIAARMAAVFGLIFKEENPARLTQSLTTATNSQGNQQAVVTLEDGSIKVVGKDGAVSQVVPQQPMNQTPDFIRAMLRLIGLPFDMPLELVAKDMSQVNFASARIGLLGYYRACRVRQRNYIARWERIRRWWLVRMLAMGRMRFARPEWERAAQAILDGRMALTADVGEAPFFAARIGTRGWDYTDPVSEAQADLLQMDMGTKSPQMICAERGRDFEEVQGELIAARMYKRMQRLSMGLGEVRSSMTRDPQGVGRPSMQIGEDGTIKLEQGGDQGAGGTPLNGTQINAAIDVLAKAREGALSDDAAAELLSQIGIDRAKSLSMVQSLSKLTTGSGDVAFKREVLKQLLTVPAAREAVYNGTDIEDLISQTGLSPEANYQAPYIPVVAPAGQLVSGGTIEDAQDDVVGGDVLPAQSGGDGTRMAGDSAPGDSAAGQDPGAAKGGDGAAQ